MDTISQSYLETQIELHKNPVYGVSSQFFVGAVRELIELHNIKSVLDYGCGKGLLKKALGDIVNEYDPAIAGKDGKPEQADLVVCLDVLEHIEPEKLGSVLEHIRSLSRKITLVNISTIEAVKFLPDGRNAHLIIEDAEWWRTKLGIYFDIKDSKEHQNNFVALMEPYLLIGDIHSIGVIAEDERVNHCRENVKITRRRVAIEKPHNRICILMCYGPSLEDTWESAIDESQLLCSDIVSVSGAHDYLIERGIKPRYHVECDPRPHKADMMRLVDHNVEYLMASCCHPDVVKRLANSQLSIWHLDNGGDSGKRIQQIENPALLIRGGGSVGLRAISLMMAMGYRRFIIHGMDCSYRDDGTTHAGKHTGKKVNKIVVKCAGRQFISSPVMLTYLKNFDDIRPLIGDQNEQDKIQIVLRGDGLLQHALLTCGGARFDLSEAA